MRAQDPSLAEEALVAAIAETVGLSPRMVRVAVRYYLAYPAEVEERIAANHEAAREAEAAWRAEQDLLGARDQALPMRSDRSWSRHGRRDRERLAGSRDHRLEDQPKPHGHE